MLENLTEWYYSDPEGKIEAGRTWIAVGSRLAPACLVVLIFSIAMARVGVPSFAQPWSAWVSGLAALGAYIGLVVLGWGILLKRHGKQMKNSI